MEPGGLVQFAAASPAVHNKLPAVISKMHRRNCQQLQYQHGQGIPQNLYLYGPKKIVVKAFLADGLL